MYKMGIINGITGEKISCLSGLIAGSSTIGIVTHTHPDGDALGSCLAMKRFIQNLKGEGYPCRIMLDSKPSETLAFLFKDVEKDYVLIYEDDAVGTAEFASTCDLLIFLDLNTIDRCGEMAKVFDGHKAEKILIDHHLDPAREGFSLVFSETAISSASELLFHILSGLCSNSGLPDSCLNPIMTGITTDTNNFANSVFPSTLETVSKLIVQGAERDYILEQLFNRYPERRLRIMGYLLSERMIVTEKGAAIIVLDSATARKYGVQEGETEGFVNLPLGIDKVKVSVFLKQDGDRYRVSLRSKRGVSANRLAKAYFNGGGHAQASGGKLQTGPGLESLKEIEDAVIRYTDKFFEDED